MVKRGKYIHYPKPFDPESGLNALMAQIAEESSDYTEAARQWTMAAKFSEKPEQCLARANWCSEMTLAEHWRL